MVGEENTTIIKLVTECFDNVKDHDFSSATTCTYTKLRDHCMKMEVEIKTKVEHTRNRAAQSTTTTHRR